MSRAVARACDGKLELMPLSHPDVRQWRKQSQQNLGRQAVWAPTLIRVRAGDVRAWTGPAMGIMLVRYLGLRSTMRVLEALVEQRPACDKRTSDQTGTRGQKRERGRLALLSTVQD